MRIFSLSSSQPQFHSWAFTELKWNYERQDETERIWDLIFTGKNRELLVGEKRISSEGEGEKEKREELPPHGWRRFEGLEWEMMEILETFIGEEEGWFEIFKPKPLLAFLREFNRYLNCFPVTFKYWTGWNTGLRWVTKWPSYIWLTARILKWGNWDLIRLKNL